MKKIFPINSLVAFSGMIACKGSDEAIPAFLRAQIPEPPQVDFEVSYDYCRITNNGLK